MHSEIHIMVSDEFQNMLFFKCKISPWAKKKRPWPNFEPPATSLIDNPMNAVVETMPGQRVDAEHGNYGRDMNRLDSKLCLLALLDIT